MNMNLDGTSTINLDWVTSLLWRIGQWALLALAAVVGCIILIAVAHLLVRLMTMLRSLRTKFTILELTPPSQSLTSSQATREFFNVLHGLSSTKPWIKRWFGVPERYSLEIVSSKNDGIRYRVYVPNDDATTLEQMVFSYMPSVKVARIQASEESAAPASCIQFKQTGHFAFPIGNKDNLITHDPIAYITGAMTHLQEDEEVFIQYVVQPTRDKRTQSIRSQLLVNGDVLRHLGGRHEGHEYGKKVSWLISDLLFNVLDGIGEIISPTTSHSMGSSNSIVNKMREAELGLRPIRTLSSSEQLLVNGVEQKVTQPLYRVNIRAYASGGTKKARRIRLMGLKTAFSSFDVPGYQSIRAAYSNFPKLLRLQLNKRLVSGSKRSLAILSAGELGAMYHFPFTPTTNTDDLVSSLYRTLPAPLSLKNNPTLDVSFGENDHHGVVTPIGLTAAERERHLYVIGGTGNGKSTLLLSSIVEDMQKGKGLAIIDPHGDLAETVLTYVPEHRLEDVIYFNPDDLGFPIGLNLLELDHSLTGDDLIRQKDIITEAVISIFRKIFSSDDSGGHRIEYVLRNACHTALTIEGATLFTIYDLLTDPSYRKTVISSLKDKHMINFWKQEFGAAGDYQKVKMAAGITAKIGRFLFSGSAKRVIEQQKSTIDFDDMLKMGKILICNFSKGKIGEDASELFGITVLAKLQLAALKRINEQQSDRRPFFTYVDEFQNFATPSFVQILSEARKYKLFMTMAEQSTSQQEDKRLVSIILANVGTLIAFRSGNPDDEKVLQPLFRPHIEQGELSNLPSYNFYIRINAVASQLPFSGHTVLLAPSTNKQISEKIVANSRQHYTKEYKEEEVMQPMVIKKTRTIKKGANILKKKAVPARAKS